MAKADSTLATETLQGKIFFLLNLLTEHRMMVFNIVGFEVIFSLLSALVPYFTKLQIDQLQSRSASIFRFAQFDPVLVFGLLLLIPATIELVRLLFFDKFRNRITDRLSTILRLDTEKLVWDKLQDLDAGFFANRRNQRIFSNILGSSRISYNFFTFLRERIGDVVSLLAILPLLGSVSWQLLILVGVTTLLQVLLSEASRRQEMALSTLQDRHSERYWRVDQALSEHFYTLRELGASDAFLQKYRQFAHERDQLSFTREAAKQSLRFYEWAISNSLTVGANLFVGWQVLQGELSLGTFTLVVAYTFQLNSIFRHLLNSMGDWREIDLQFDRLNFFFSLKTRLTSSDKPITDFSDLGRLEFKQVHFSYPDLSAEERSYLDFIIRKTKGFLSKFSSYRYSSELKDWQEAIEDGSQKAEVLSGVNLKIEKGKVVALLGRNGAGKTTITHLAMHHYDPTEGEVLMNGKSLTKYDPILLGRQFGIIQQQPFILQQFSIRENMLLGVNPVASDEHIWQVLSKLGIEDFVSQLPKQLDTILGEGTSLSGGQEQLLAVARIFLQQRPFIIFDEGMNQMDIEKETAVMSLLKKEAERAGVLFITHRITTARKADYIYMLDEGLVVEEGTHVGLIKKNGLYAKFWNMQVIE